METPPVEIISWTDLILKLWPVWAAIGAAFAGALGWRFFEKANIHKTNAANITALQALLETREKENAVKDAEIQEQNETIADLDETIANGNAKYDTLQSEYKTLAGIVITDLLHFAANQALYAKELEEKDNRIHLLENQVAFLERNAAENLIHKSQ